MRKMKPEEVVDAIVKINTEIKVFWGSGARVKDGGRSECSGVY